MISTTQQHTGESLAGLPLIPPKEAKTYWVGLPHDMLLKSLRDELGKQSTYLGDWKCHLSPKGEDMAFSGETTHCKLLHYGLLNCNSWQSAARVYLGLKVGQTAVPVNEVVLGKHTLRLVRELDKRMAAAIKILDRSHREHVKTIKEWEKKPCKDQHWQVLHEALKRRCWGSGPGHLLPQKRFQTILDHIEGHGNTVASMLEGFAIATRMGPTLKQLPNMLKFYSMLKEKDQ